jgi:uncharacterized protein (DUF983 family)
MPAHTSAVKKWTLAIALAIVFNLFVNFGITTFYPAPDYNDYCGTERVPDFAKPTLDCPTITPSEQLVDNCGKGYVAYRYDSNGCATSAYCETCGVGYNAARDKHNGAASIVLLIAAVLALAAGIGIKVESVSTGFLLAGVLGFFITATRYWGELQNVMRFLILGVTLAVLVWLGYKKIK